VTGALYYNSTVQAMKVYDGAAWITATAAGTSAMSRYRYVATSGQTTFSGSDANSLTLSYTSGNIVVARNGAVLDPSEYTASNGTSVVLGVAAGTGDVVDIVAFKSFTVADTYSKAEVDGFTVKLTGAQTVAGVKTFSDQPVFSAGVSLGSNGQIKFPATQNASSDANTLDDYEEGTWTPNDASGTGLSFSIAQGYYTKVGNLVSAFFRVDYPSTASGTQAKIGGLPFTVRAGYDGANSGTFLRYTSYSSTTLLLPPGNSTTELPAFSPGGSSVSNASLSLKRIDAVVVYQSA
jgi:hypothetical protein